MKNKYGIKVGDVIKTKQYIYSGIPDYGDVIVLDLLSKTRALIKFINTGNITEIKLAYLNSGRIRDTLVYEAYLAGKYRPKFNELVEELWKEWNPESGIDGAKYVPVLGSEAGSNFLTTIVGKTLVDDWFYEKYWGIALILDGGGYVTISSKKDNIKKYFNVDLCNRIKPIKLHHFIKAHTNFKNYVVDHINGDKLDNRFSNLRTATASQNSRNSIKSVSSKSKFKGVYYVAKNESVKGKLNKTWRAYIFVNGKYHYKMCRTEIEAALAYNELALKYHGEFARLNEIT